MNRKLPKTKGIFLENDILSSEAYWSLNGTDIKVLNIFRMKCVVKRVNSGKRNGNIIVNNGEIQFTFLEARRNYGISKSSFLRARDKLIEVGFIEIAQDGGTHAPTLYAISENWRKYPEESFTRLKSANLVGVSTRFIKDTVKSDTN